MSVETRLHAVGGSLSEAALTGGAEVLAVPVLAGPEAPAAEIAAFLPFTLNELLTLHNAKGEPGEIIATPIRLGEQVRELLLYGVGDASPEALRRAGAALARRGRGRTAMLAGVPSGDLGAFAQGALLGSYDFSLRGSQNGNGRRSAPDGTPGPTTGGKRPLATLGVLTEDAMTEAGLARTEAALARGAVVAGAVALARDLANMPSGTKNPAWLAEQARDLAAETGLGVRIRDEGALRAEGFGGILAVGAGSASPPRLIELSYDPGQDAAHPGQAAAAHVVLVGKGITFDSGGLSLKPNEGMKTMKTDMAGGGVVMAVMGALRSAGVGVRVTGLIAVAENMPSGSAMRPSDVIRHYGGKTSEVLNTDAEGRLVLADALAYADAVLRPDVVVDIATLTGAAKVALGLRHGALFATDDPLADALIRAGGQSGEPLWRLPLVEDYRAAIESEVADVSNIGQHGFGGGSITAALFLREFAGDRPWAHLDVAGPARSNSDEGELSKGATGFGARLLLEWLTEL
ncbi:leucyl aminopeptidase [Actinomadura scrupuli]|uniref:leucyl aminopeptidase n=1 Tax=Actinomadura scrupuli TaxID=559629 RepID=UPI003D966F36